MTNEINITSDINNLKLMVEGEQNNTTELPLRRSGFDEDKEFLKFIKNTERLVRNSIEYREWVSYIKDILGFSNCALTDENTNEVTLEIHHHPINLYTICKGIITSYINKEKRFCTYDIALDCINLHYKNQIGYIPLISTLHEKFHNGFLKIAIEKVSGDWKYILNNYPLDEVDVSIISEFAQVKLEDIKQSWTKNNYPGVINE